MNQPNHHRHRRRATPLPLLFAATPVGAALLMGVQIAIIGGSGVRALPQDNGQHNINSNSLRSLSGRRSDGDGNGGGSRGGSSTPRGSVALHDSFPCETDPPAAASNSSNRSTDHGGDAVSGPASSSDHLSGNSFMALNNIEVPKSNTSSSVLSPAGSSTVDAPRGGATTDALPSGELDDDEIDRMVESLIASVDDDDEGGEEESEEEEVEESDDGDDDVLLADDYESEAVDGTEEQESDWVDEEEEDEEEEGSEEQDKEKIVETPSSSKPIRKQQAHSSPVQSNTQQLDGRPIPDKSSPLVMPPGTPTNAYYRFLVRRGPKGHVIAAFSLVAVQWIYVYLPFLYNTCAAILLKLRVYNPKVLYERDYQRQLRKRYGPPPKKKGFSTKIFGTAKKGSKKAQAAAVARKQKADDVEAAAKLKQLYKTLKSGASAMSEVKYRYLSVAFRERHGLGREYRAEKPRSFMGEIVEDGRESGLGEEVDARDIVFSDEEDAEELSGGVSEASATQSEGASAKQRPGGKSSSEQRRRPRRKRIDDWVVRAFAPSSAKSGKGESSRNSLWNSVDRTAILDAAWESRAAEQSARRGRAGPASRGDGGSGSNRDDQDEEELDGIAAGGPGSSSSYGASKMFQSVMTRVGSNGRMLGAYPNDAPPIHLCANRRGVVELARKYGYGDWSRTSEEEFGADGLEEEVSDDGDESWGGGDLIFGELEGADDKGVAAGAEEDSTPSRIKKRRRRASKRGSSRRRRRRKKSSLK